MLLKFTYENYLLIKKVVEEHKELSMHYPGFPIKQSIQENR